MDRTTNLALSLMQPNQAAKHITVNEGLVALDRAAQLRLRSLDRSDPPIAAERTAGDTFATSDSPTGAWAGNPHSLAIDLGTQWRFIALQPGFHGVDLSNSAVVVWTGAAWAVAGSDAFPDTVPELGIGTPPASGQALTVQGAGTLLTHAGTDVRQTLNRASADDVCSVLFQTGFSAGAEIGLVGDGRATLRTFDAGGAATEHCAAEPGIAGLQSANFRSRRIAVLKDQVMELVPPQTSGIVAITNRHPDYPQANSAGIFSYDVGLSPQLITMVALSGLSNQNTSDLNASPGPADILSLSARRDVIQLGNRRSIKDFTLTFLG